MTIDPKDLDRREAAAKDTIGALAKDVLRKANGALP